MTFAPWNQDQIARILDLSRMLQNTKGETYVIDPKLRKVALQGVHAVHHVGLHWCCEGLPI